MVAGLNQRQARSSGPPLQPSRNPVQCWTLPRGCWLNRILQAPFLGCWDEPESLGVTEAWKAEDSAHISGAFTGAARAGPVGYSFSKPGQCKQALQTPEQGSTQPNHRRVIRRECLLRKSYSLSCGWGRGGTFSAPLSVPDFSHSCCRGGRAFLMFKKTSQE